MNHQQFEHWLQRYAKAWETRDMSVADTLFTKTATYQETPFDEPLRGYQAIVEYGQNVNARQAEVNFTYDIIAVSEEVGVAHWRVSFIQKPEQEHVTLDGIFVVKLNDNGQCTEFREWWHAKHE